MRAAPLERLYGFVGRPLSGDPLEREDEPEGVSARAFLPWRRRRASQPAQHRLEQDEQHVTDRDGTEEAVQSATTSVSPKSRLPIDISVGSW
jgi:hypothetical protein